MARRQSVVAPSTTPLMPSVERTDKGPEEIFAFLRKRLLAASSSHRQQLEVEVIVFHFARMRMGHSGHILEEMGIEDGIL